MRTVSFREGTPIEKSQTTRRPKPPGPLCWFYLLEKLTGLGVAKNQEHGTMVLVQLGGLICRKPRGFTGYLEDQAPGRVHVSGDRITPYLQAINNRTFGRGIKRIWGTCQSWLSTTSVDTSWVPILQVANIQLRRVTHVDVFEGRHHGAASFPKLSVLPPAKNDSNVKRHPIWRFMSHLYSILYTCTHFESHLLSTLDLLV